MTFMEAKHGKGQIYGFNLGVKKNPATTECPKNPVQLS